MNEETQFSLSETIFKCVSTNALDITIHCMLLFECGTGNLTVVVVDYKH